MSLMFRHRLKLLAILFLVATAIVLSGQPVRRHILALYISEFGEKQKSDSAGSLKIQGPLAGTVSGRIARVR